MKFSWVERTRSSGWSAYLHAGALQAGYIEQLGSEDYNACDMSTNKWEWRRFDNIPEAKAWLEVCARMSDALA